MAKAQPPVNVNSVTWTPVYAITPNSKQVTVQETGQAASTDFLVAFPAQTDGPKTCGAGKEFVLTSPSPFTPQSNGGPAILWLKTISGSVNFDIHEE